ncbi:hypothetical protein PC128_g15809 [Phytophthora cactorum]|uniref:Uncharacterized protein n=1 Tax=Phytophthora cactorum TaxID=29920 RepID=A0A8T1CVF6_9STRA|nr:hypothetical protein PC117_g13731 [Phytophthora cactorum]KAG3078603.1 hypothetical protein PC122_g12591 [Phytophthora cactorum]KAG3179788.1 hypothetical protein PC128_g15809 [Phytophthora cactorum]
MGVWVPPSRDGYGGTLRFRDAQDDRYCYVRTKVSGHVAILVTIRDQSALLFRCLYISGEKKALDLATHFFFE